MPWRWTNPDARPISEYLYDYHLFRKTQHLLYYCRECIRNFDTPERVEKCPRCNHANVIELPKETKIKSRKSAKKYGKNELAKDLVKSRKELGMMLNVLRLSLLRIRIAIYYFLMPATDELK